VLGKLQLLFKLVGRLAVSEENPKMLVTVAEIEAKFKTKIDAMGKFLAGDNRANEMPALTALHVGKSKNLKNYPRYKY
jgi:hypothetical protein